MTLSLACDAFGSVGWEIPPELVSEPLKSTWKPPKLMELLMRCNAGSMHIKRRAV